MKCLGPIVEIKPKNNPPELVMFGGDPVVGGWPCDMDKLLAAKAKGKRIYDFLPDIGFSKPDQDILKSWTDWFTARKVPWAVTKGRGYKLWRIWGGMTDKEMKKMAETISWKKGG